MPSGLRIDQVRGRGVEEGEVGLAVAVEIAAPLEAAEGLTVTVETAGVTSRTRSLPMSAMNRSPAASTATPIGESSSAAVAGPPSPL